MLSVSTIQYLETLPRFAAKPGLERMRKILEFLGNPQQGLKYVHVTGTNGKGSTSATIESILRHAGYRTGLFTSPHLFAYNERIKVNAQDIADEDFSKNLDRVRVLVERMVREDESMRPALFEVLLAMAFLHFQDEKIDIAVLEVGIGGLLDPTNVIDGLVAVITNVDLEHAEILGDTKEKIAEQKAGIIKKGAVVLTADEDTRVIDILARTARENDAQFLLLKPEDVQLTHQSLEGQVFDFGSYEALRIPFLGNYQMLNTALAVLTAESLRKFGFRIDEQAIRDGLRSVYWPLRLEIVHQDPVILMDGAHNLHGIRTLHQVLHDIFPERRKILVLGVSSDKPYREMARLLAEEVSVVIVTQAQYRAARCEDLAESIADLKKEMYLTSDVKEALLKAKFLAKEDDLILVLGGLYLAAEARKAVDEIFS